MQASKIEGISVVRISRIDQRIYSLLTNHGQIELSVHARFNSSICTFGFEEFVTILNKNKHLLPMSIVIDGEINDLISGSKELLLLSESADADLIVDSGTEVVDLRLYPMQTGSVVKDLDGIREFLLENGNEDSFFPYLVQLSRLGFSGTDDKNHSDVHAFFVERMAAFVAGLENGDLESTPSILGFGRGLTPSSDDFILGLYCVLIFMNSANILELTRYIERYKDQTTEVSSWMLHYVTYHDLVPEFVKDFFEKGCDANNLVRFLEHGSTSGIDLLCGIYYGLKTSG